MIIEGLYQPNANRILTELQKKVGDYDRMIEGVEVGGDYYQTLVATRKMYVEMRNAAHKIHLMNLETIESQKEKNNNG